MCFYEPNNITESVAMYIYFKGIVSRDFEVYFLLSIDRSSVGTPSGARFLLLKCGFWIEYFDFCVSV
jgi:hypothetical protein